MSVSATEPEPIVKAVPSELHRLMRAGLAGLFVGLLLGGAVLATRLAYGNSGLRYLPRTWPGVAICVAVLGGLGGAVGLVTALARQVVGSSRGHHLRWRILRTLLHKELLRHLANRGGIALIMLLVVMSLMLSLSKSTSQGPLLGGNVQRCYLIYKKDDPERKDIERWIAHLRKQRPDEWNDDMFRIRTADKMPTDSDGKIVLQNAGSIYIESNGKDAEGRPKFKVAFWYPGDNSAVLGTFESWFWRESARYFSPHPEIEESKIRSIGSADLRSALAPVPVIFALFFACVYLLPSMTCEERERGVLLAQALSPASPLEILASKFLFYSTLGIGLGALLAGIYRPAILLQPFFWLAVIVSSLGSMSIGLTIATLAKTQRLASVGAMCYLLMVALFLLTMQQIDLPYLPWLFLEFHTPKMLEAAMADSVMIWHWFNLLFAALLAVGWTILATILFRHRGWQ